MRPSFDYRLFISGRSVRRRKGTAGVSTVGGYHTLWKLGKGTFQLGNCGDLSGEVRKKINTNLSLSPTPHDVIYKIRDREQDHPANNPCQKAGCSAETRWDGCRLLRWMILLSFSCIYGLLLLAWEGEEVVGICQPHCIKKKTIGRILKYRVQTERSSSMIEFLLNIQKALCLIQSTTEKMGGGTEARGRIGREGRYCPQLVPWSLVQMAR